MKKDIFRSVRLYCENNLDWIVMIVISVILIRFLQTGTINKPSLKKIICDLPKCFKPNLTYM